MLNETYTEKVNRFTIVKDEATLVKDLRVNADFQKNVKNNTYLSQLLNTTADYIENVQRVNKDKLNQNIELMQSALLEKHYD